VFALAASATVELMAHPIEAPEYDYLMSDAYARALRAVTPGTYAAVCA
jgi:hypothetical protein